MLLESGLPEPEPAEQPARAITAAMAAEMVSVFFMKSGPRKYQRRVGARVCCVRAVAAAPTEGTAY
jgi:hypothetical protein